MKCEDLRSQFSERLDGELQGAALAEHEAHCAKCSACAEAWEEFAASIGDLRGLGVQPVTDTYVDSLVAAAIAAPVVAGAGRERRPWLLTHAAALLLGAALVLLFLRVFGDRFLSQTVLEEQQESSLAEADRTPATAGTGAPSKETQLPTIENLPFDREPRVEIVREFVERIEYIATPAPPAEILRVGPSTGEVNAITSALSRFGESLASVSRALSERAESSAGQNPLEQSIAQVTPPSAETPKSARAASDAPRPNRRRVEANTPPATLVVTQRDGALSIVTRGSLDEVVPALISRVGDQDQRISELVQSRLREIWADRTGRSPDEAPFGVAMAEPEMGRFGWRRWYEEPSKSNPSLDTEEQWAQWWSQESSLIASATF